LCAACLLVFNFGFAQTQTLVPELSFTNPLLKTGTRAAPGQDGAIYIFNEVASGIDAIIRINGRSNPQVRLLSIDQPCKAGDSGSTQCSDAAWQPIIAFDGRETPSPNSWWMEFEILFLKHGNDRQPVIASQFCSEWLGLGENSPSLHENLSFYGLQSYTTDKNSGIQATQVKGCICDPSLSGMEFMGPAIRFSSASSGAPRLMVSGNFANTNRLVVRIGSDKEANDGAVTQRLSSILFKDFKYEEADKDPDSDGFAEFTASLDQRRVMLEWSTTTSVQPRFFTVQRSTDGVFFSDDALVFTSDEEPSGRSYQYADRIRLEEEGPLYFRIRTLDKDSHCRFSNTIRINTQDGLTGATLAQTHISL
jgi:hypothetical protein